MANRVHFIMRVVHSSQMYCTLQSGSEFDKYILSSYSLRNETSWEREMRKTAQVSSCTYSAAYAFSKLFYPCTDVACIYLELLLGETRLIYTDTPQHVNSIHVLYLFLYLAGHSHPCKLIHTGRPAGSKGCTKSARANSRPRTPACFQVHEKNPVF